LEQLAEDGATRFSMDAVAARAHASKATLYRRWPSAAALLVDAMETTFAPFATPDTGSVRQDLRHVLHGAVHLLTTTPFPRLLAAVIDLAERDPDLAATHAALTNRQRAPLLHILQRGQERGEIGASADLEVLVDLLAAPLFYRRFVAHHPIPATLPETIIHTVLGPDPRHHRRQHSSGSDRR